MAEVRLKWFHGFLFLFQAFLSVADTTTDILTCLKYRELGHNNWFAVSLGVTVFTLTVLCVWSIVASTSRTWATDDEDEIDSPDVIFRNTALNLLLGCLCIGPPLHSFQLFLFCACNFSELWNASNGIRIDKNRLYYLYIHTLNLKMVEGLLEAAPQLMIQVYVMVASNERVTLIQMISAPISFITLTWMVTCTEVFRELAHYNITFLHNIIIFLSNIGIIAARTLAIIFFTLAFNWWLPLVLCAHWLLVNLMGFSVWRSTGSKRKQDMLLFILAHSPLYLFTYSSYNLKKLRGASPLSCVLQNFITISWHFIFTIENIVMIALYYWSPHERAWFDTPTLAVVLVGNIGGIALKMIAWNCCFSKNPLDDELEQRRETIVIKTLPRD